MGTQHQFFCIEMVMVASLAAMMPAKLQLDGRQTDYSYINTAVVVLCSINVHTGIELKAAELQY